MNNQISVSIIIPVYNIEKYIEVCLKHLICRTSLTYEVLIVEDGSSDNSNEIIKKIIKNQRNFYLIEKNNGGLSSARNSGLKMAKGDYIFFLDGDDFIDISQVEKIYEFAAMNELDIAVGNGKYYFEGNSKKNKYFYAGEKLRKIKDVTSGKYMFSYMIKHNSYKVEVWDKLYRKEFLENNNLLFKEGIFQEDELFTPKAFLKAARVSYFGNIDYNYRQREDSITKTGTVINCLSYIEVIEDLYKLYDEKDEMFTEALRKRLNQLYFRTLQSSFDLNEEEKLAIWNLLSKYKFDFNFSFKIRNLLYKKNQSLYKILYIKYKSLRYLVLGKI